ncbi:hypothetical protein TWF281_008311 [Arthrobotrys megalospora]
MRGLRFSVLVTFLITLVSLCAARTVITIEKCTTRFCGSPVKVYRTTKTVRTTARYTVTRWKTVIKPAATKTFTESASWGFQTDTTTLHTITQFKTIWIGTRTHTRKFTAIVPTTVLIPIPPGIVGVNQDPDNKAAQTIRPQKRDAEPEPVPELELELLAERAAKYASAVTCTKTLLTKTGTSDLWKTTTKTSGTRTITVPGHLITIVDTTTAKGAKTVVVTTGMSKVAFDSTTITLTRPNPTPTYYQACGYRNRAPPQELLNRQWLLEGAGWDEDEPTIYTEGQMNAYDCCVSCWTLPASQGKCVGSIWHYIGPWGPPLCDWEHDENCGITPPDEPTGSCRLILEAKKGVCRRHTYTYYGPDLSVGPYVISNGPGCLRWKWTPMQRG